MKVFYAEVLEMDEDEPIELAKEHGIELTRMTFDDLQDAAGCYVCTKRDFESANGDDEDEEEDEEEEKKKEKDEDGEDDEDEDDEDDGAIQRLSRQAGNIQRGIAGLKRTTQLAELSRRVREAPRQRVSQRAPAKAGGLRLCAPHLFLDKSGDSRPGRHSH